MTGEKTMIMQRSGRLSGQIAGLIAGLIAVLVAVLVVAGCSAPSGGGASPTPAGPTAAASPSGSGKITGKITVLGAASLTEAFTTIGKDFQAAHPGTTVTFSFGSSATLATQINQGAPADVFASADERTMKMVTDAGQATDPAAFATNTLQIAVPPGNPGKITGLADFGSRSNRTVVCAPEVPCGAAAQQVFDRARVKAEPVSYETDVKAALQKVEHDEANAALVYRTDVAAAGRSVEGITFPEAQKVINTYPIAAVKGSSNPATAAAFVAYVTGPGEQVLRKAGFGAP